VTTFLRLLKFLDSFRFSAGKGSSEAVGLLELKKVNVMVREVLSLWSRGQKLSRYCVWDTSCC